MQSGMQFREYLSYTIVEGLRRVTLIATTINPDRGVVAHAKYRVSGVAEKQRIVVGFGAIPRVREPEVLPHHDAVLIACVIEFVVADLAYPVPYHVEIHLAVIAKRSVVLTLAETQHRLAESPVAAAWNESPAVNPYPKRAAIFAVGHLADTGFQRLCV